MIIDDQGYNRILDTFKVEVDKDGHVLIDMASLITLNESIAAWMMSDPAQFEPDEFMGMAQMVEVYRNLYDTITSRLADKMVPDDLSSLQELGNRNDN